MPFASQIAKVGVHLIRVSPYKLTGLPYSQKEELLFNRPTDVRNILKSPDIASCHILRRVFTTMLSHNSLAGNQRGCL